MAEYQIKQIKDMNVCTIEAGYKRLIDKLIENGFKFNNVFSTNKNRYRILFGKPYNILIMFKKEPFYNFGLIFRKEGQKGVGETVNLKDLKKAYEYKVEYIYTMFPNGIVYRIKLIDFLNKSFKRVVKEGVEVRSISIHEFERVFEV